MSGRLCIVCADAEFSRAATASASGLDREVQEVGLDAARRGVAARVRMDRQEQIRAFAVRDRGPLLERHEHVGVARHHDLHARLLLEQLLQPQRDVERQFRLVDAVALRARIVAAVAGVDDDARHAQPELPRERELAVRVRRRRPPAAMPAATARRQRAACASGRGVRRLGAGVAAIGAGGGVVARGTPARPTASDRRTRAASTGSAAAQRRGGAGVRRRGAARPLEIDHQPIRVVERIDAVARPPPACPRRPASCSADGARAGLPAPRRRRTSASRPAAMPTGLRVLQIEEHPPRVARAASW